MRQNSTLSRSRVLLSLLLLQFFAVFCAGSEPSAGQEGLSANRQAVDDLFKREREAHAGDPAMLVLPGLIADSKARTVTLRAESTGIRENENIEFLIIGPGSGHGYESFAVSFALPSDIHRALEFIGLQPGRPVNPGALAFWPKGERVHMTVIPADTGIADAGIWKAPVRVEELVWNDSIGEVMPLSGHVFTGSLTVPTPGGNAGTVYAADRVEPRSVASNYNEPGSVFDVPRQAPQGDVYRSNIMKGSHVLPDRSLLVFTITPEYPDGRRRVNDLDLTLTGHAPGTAAGNAAGWFTLTDTASGQRIANTNLAGTVRHFSQLIDSGRDPYVSVKVADSAPLGLVRDTAALIASIEGDTGIRVEPPPEGTLYYRAYLPNETYRSRSGRMSQPWELHLARNGQQVSGMLADVHEAPPGTKPDAPFTITETAVQSGHDVRAFLDSALRSELQQAIGMLPDSARRTELSKRATDTPAPDLWSSEAEAIHRAVQDALFEIDRYDSLPDRVLNLRVLFVYAPSDLTHGELMTFLTPVTGTHPTVHVYLPVAP